MIAADQLHNDPLRDGAILGAGHDPLQKPTGIHVIDDRL